MRKLGRWLRSLRAQYALAVAVALVGCAAAASSLSILRQREEWLASLRQRAMPIFRHSRGLAKALVDRDTARVAGELTPWLRGQETAFATVYDAAAQPVWHSPTPVDTPPLDGEEVARLRGRGEPLWRVRGAASARVYVVSLPIEWGSKLVGVVRLGYPLEEVVLRERAAWRHAVEVSAGVVAVGLLVAYLLRGAVVRPLRRLTDEMRRVAAGDLQRTIEVPCDDEVGVAATTFNEMTRHLRAARTTIEKHNETLAAEVARARRDLESTQARLIQSARLAATGRLAAGVAHEINNPLTGILVLTECLCEVCREPAVQRDLREIESQARRCQEIVQNLVAFASDQPLRCRAVDVNRVVDRALDAVRRQHTHPRIRVVRDLASNLAPVAGDPDQLERAFRNIIANAYQALGLTGRLTVTTASVGPAVVVSIADTGQGMGPEALEQIFDPFFSTRAVGKGVGLGLSVSHGIIRRHRGKATVKSHKGQGTTVAIELPCAAPVAQGARVGGRESGRVGRGAGGVESGA